MNETYEVRLYAMLGWKKKIGANQRTGVKGAEGEMSGKE